MEELKAQLKEINEEISSLSMSGSDKGATFAKLKKSAEELASRSVEIEQDALTAENRAAAARNQAEKARDEFENAKLSTRQISTEIQTLTKLLATDENPDWPPILENIKVKPGYETALGAALGDDLDATTNPDAPAHWGANDGGNNGGLELPPLPAGAEPLTGKVDAPDQIRARLSQIGIIDAGSGPALQKELRPGQRLVSKAGDLWRWDGFTALADAPLPVFIDNDFDNNRLNKYLHPPDINRNSNTDKTAGNR